MGKTLRSRLAWIGYALVLLVGVTGCTSLLGDFGASGADASLDGSLATDAGSDVTLDPGDTGASDAAKADASDASDAAAPDSCVPETDDALCRNARKECDGFDTVDGCGARRTIATCGGCAAPLQCGAQTPNVCGCKAETDAAVCLRLGLNCGPVTTRDTCGTARNIASCGTCTSPQTCGPQVANVCGGSVCTAETNDAFCKRYGATCGSVSNTDNCGKSRTVDCGACTLPLTCSASHACACVPEDNATFCKDYAASCGSASGRDNCGTARTVNCGSCAPPNVCSAGACVCAPETDAAFCSRLGHDCGALSGTDNCGVSRSVASCGTCTSTNTCNAGGVCACGKLAACTAGQTCCADGCHDLTSDPKNCGGCGTACGGGVGDAWVCTNTVCSCAGSTDPTCKGQCNHLGTVTNCAFCGNTCAPNEGCCGIKLGNSCDTRCPVSQ